MRSLDEARAAARNGKREPPWSHDDEWALLGACLGGLYQREACEVLAEQVSVEDFYRPRHSHWAEAIIEIAKTGPVDTVLVARWLNDRHGWTDELPDLLKALGDCPASSNAAAYARNIVELAGYRRAIAAAGELAAGSYERMPLDELVEQAHTRLNEIDRPTGVYVPPDVDTYLAQTPEYDWLVAGQLEHRERTMVTGPEGGGKTELLLQLGVQYSAGLNPFARTRIEPISVLMVMIENRRSHMKRRLGYLRNLVAHDIQLRLGTAASPYDPRRLRVEIAEGGVNLLRRADRNWFTGLLAGSKPDLVICGPVYKMLAGEDENDSKPAATMAAYIEELCKRFNSAFLIEAHCAKGEHGKQRPVVPIGTSFWQRWPEFGFGLRQRPPLDPSNPREPQVWDWVPWKVRDRDRAWPVALRHGEGWPWQNHYGTTWGEEEEAF